jgi:adenylosuccinate synthase
MMMDVLSQLPQIQICVAYDLRGERICHFPSQTDDLRQVEPVYETFPGWERDVRGVRRWRDLPSGARGYLDRVSELVGRPIEFISVGPERDETILVNGNP